jgi:hypothetical protein
MSAWVKSGVFGRRLYRQVGWLLALDDAINVAGCPAILVDQVRSIAAYHGIKRLRFDI